VHEVNDIMNYSTSSINQTKKDAIAKNDLYLASPIEQELLDGLQPYL
jgi:hypothetical protein